MVDLSRNCHHLLALDEQEECQTETMAETTCRICLSTSDSASRQMQLVLEDGEPFHETLWFKLKSIGFWQAAESCDLNWQLCSLCAARVQDAYDLKLQCLEASRIFQQENVAETYIKDLTTNEPLLGNVNPSSVDSAKCSQMNAICQPSSREEPELAKVASRECPMISSLPDVIASAQDMFTCVQNLSSILKFNVALLTNATQFMENTLSFLTVLFSLKEETPAMKKSAQTIRNEAELWKMKSAMMGDVSGFLREVSSTNFLSGIPPSKLPKKSSRSVEIPRPSPALVPLSSESVSSDKCTSESPARSVMPTETKASPDSSTLCPFPEQVKKKRNKSFLKSNMCDGLSAAEDNQAVRRSFRSRSIVDTLVYWPSFKKQGASHSKSTSSKLKSSKKNSSDALDSLLLKRSADSGSENKSASDEKWAIVRKRKADQTAGRKWSWKAKMKVRCSSVSISSSQNDCSETDEGTHKDYGKEEAEKNFAESIEGKEDGVEEMDLAISENKEEKDENAAEKNKVDLPENRIEEEEYQDSKSPGQPVSPSNTCTICGKTLTCNRNLQAHIKMHMGSSPFQCNYCHKTFSSSWNRAQHERVHTGEKPYVCDICHEPFRYNVTLRHHKVKQHTSVN